MGGDTSTSRLAMSDRDRGRDRDRREVERESEGGLKPGCPALGIGSLRLLPWPTQQRTNWAMNRHAGRLCSFVSGELNKASLEREWTTWQRNSALPPAQRPQERPAPWKTQMYTALVEYVQGACAGGLGPVPPGAEAAMRLLRRVSRSRRRSAGTPKMASLCQWLCFSETVKQHRTRVMFGYVGRSQSFVRFGASRRLRLVHASCVPCLVG